MSSKQKKILWAIIAVTVTTTLLGYFGRPHPPLLQVSTPSQELPNYEAHYPGDTSLAHRLVSSYGLAMVLVQSPYTQKNVVALEALRSWARLRFQQQPDFLHPVSLPPTTDFGATLLDASAYQLFAGLRYWLEEKAGLLVQYRVAAFHESNAYLSFRNAYFDLFGLSNDSAILLASYQSERAKQAVDVLLWGLLFLLSVLGGALYIAGKKPAKRFDAAQQALANLWLLISAAYLLSACMSNQSSLLVGSFGAAVIGICLRKPFIITSQDGFLKIKFVALPFNLVALAFFVTYSMICIQALTWIRFGSMLSPDPITLLLSCFSGNFLQEPVHAKRLIAQIAGISWFVVGAWTTSQFAVDAKAASENEETLAQMQTNTRVLTR